MNYLNYFLIIIGAIVAMYAKTGTNHNQYVLIGGIVLLMIGIYRISRNIKSRSLKDNDDGNTKDD